MSCRVIGRTVEMEMLHHLCLEAQQRGCHWLRGTYIPSGMNGLVADLFERSGFSRSNVDLDGHTSEWEYDLAANGPITNTFIDSRADKRAMHGPA